MYFEDRNQDNENNNFSLDDDAGKSISWDDLVNEDDEIDVSDVLKDDEGNARSNNSKSSFNSYMAEGNNNDIVNISSPEFNLQDTANSYVNSLDISETTVDLNSYGEQGEMMKFGNSDNGGNFEQNAQNSEQNSDFGGFDSDILSMLDNNQEQQDTVNSITFNSTPDEQNSDFNQEQEQYENYSQANNTNNYSNNGGTPIGIYPEANRNKKKAPVLLFALIGLIGLVAVAYFIMKVAAPKPRVLEANELVALRQVVDGVVVQERFVPKEQAEKEKAALEKETGGVIEIAEVDENTYGQGYADSNPDEEGSGNTPSSAPAPKKQDTTSQSQNVKEPLTIVSLSYGGRKNPFVPSGDFGMGISGADISLPPDLNEDDPAMVEARKLLTIKVSGIVFDDIKPSAIVNFDQKDYFVQIGDRIDTYTVSGITKEFVSIKNGTNIYSARVGEEFIIEDTLPESKQMKIGPNGHRQYISSDDIQISTK